MKFFSDNAAPVHPKVWDALKAADSFDSACDGDALSQRMVGARCANAATHLGCAPREITCAAGVTALSFDFIKKDAMNAKPRILVEPDLAERTRLYRKRSGHLQSKGRYLAAQILAMLQGDLWLANAETANDAVREIGAAAGERLLYRVEANEVFTTLTSDKVATLRTFYDWPAPAGQAAMVRFVTAWNSEPDQIAALVKAIREL